MMYKDAISDRLKALQSNIKSLQEFLESVDEFGHVCTLPEDNVKANDLMLSLNNNLAIALMDADEVMGHITECYGN